VLDYELNHSPTRSLSHWRSGLDADNGTSLFLVVCLCVCRATLSLGRIALGSCECAVCATTRLQVVPPNTASAPSPPQPTHWPHLSHILTHISKAHVSACLTRVKQSISLARTLHPELTLCTHQLRDDLRCSNQRQERHASDEMARRRDRPRDARSGWQVSFDKNMSTGSIGKSTRGLRTDRRHLLSRATHPRHLPVRVPF
jgi:hypothetical protein